jgi:hypothetical protein
MLMDALDLSLESRLLSWRVVLGGKYTSWPFPSNPLPVQPQWMKQSTREA